MKTSFFSKSSEWTLLKYLTFRQNEKNWTFDKTQEHNTYTNSLRAMISSGTSDQKAKSASALKNSQQAWECDHRVTKGSQVDHRVIPHHNTSGLPAEAFRVLLDHRVRCWLPLSAGRHLSRHNTRRFETIAIGPFVELLRDHRVRRGYGSQLTSTQQKDSQSVNNFWQEVGSKAALQHLDETFCLERTLEHNEYLNEVGQRRKQVMKHLSENDDVDLSKPPKRLAINHLRDRSKDEDGIELQDPEDQDEIDKESDGFTTYVDATSINGGSRKAAVTSSKRKVTSIDDDSDERQSQDSISKASESNNVSEYVPRYGWLLYVAYSFPYFSSDATSDDDDRETCKDKVVIVKCSSTKVIEHLENELVKTSTSENLESQYTGKDEESEEITAVDDTMSISACLSQKEDVNVEMDSESTKEDIDHNEQEGLWLQDWDKWAICLAAGKKSAAHIHRYVTYSINAFVLHFVFLK
ncbi:hypothetical protein BC936DRAFT_139189 [Jimgerdemannia flammicorona]|uniref:Uncharacterized protein n=1 Tax=Jimgerdemannia flammicorona TaxID=994334 RepID=A0A433BAG5_9FUNG|nr:hypothetical protein BC936DRAFT_139189 [Jimgerdemannia flammicorona]